MDAENVKNQLSLLRTQRGRQLNRLHEEEKKLDRLDYLRYKLEKQLARGREQSLERAPTMKRNHKKSVLSSIQVFETGQ